MRSSGVVFSLRPEFPSETLPTLQVTKILTNKLYAKDVLVILCDDNICTERVGCSPMTKDLVSSFLKVKEQSHKIFDLQLKNLMLLSLKCTVDSESAGHHFFYAGKTYYRPFRGAF